MLHSGLLQVCVGQEEHGSHHDEKSDGEPSVVRL
jgi:hypothetical protein